MEEWRTVKGYEGRYEVSNMGNVRGYSAYHNKSIPVWKVLKPGKAGSNPNAPYLYCHFFDGKNHYVHRLVATAFLPNMFNLPQVNHKDGNKLNNNVSNLRWESASDNMTHSVRVLGNTPPVKTGETNGRAVLTQAQADEIRIKLSQNVSGRSLALEYKTTDSVISKIKLGKTYI
jgi:hypothetical protein